MPAESSGRMAIWPVESQSVETVCRSAFSIGIGGATKTKSTPAESWPRKSLTDIRKARNQARALIDEQKLLAWAFVFSVPEAEVSSLRPLEQKTVRIWIRA
jgi:hypothetical protein